MTSRASLKPENEIELYLISILRCRPSIERRKVEVIDMDGSLLIDVNASTRDPLA